jgi:hypothetical protein
MTKLSKASRLQWTNWQSWESMLITKGCSLCLAWVLKRPRTILLRLLLLERLNLSGTAEGRGAVDVDHRGRSFVVPHA